jgi:hypothetical protein
MLETVTNTAFRPISIAFDFSNLQTANSELKSFIQDVLVVQLQHRVESLIKVNGPTTIPKFNETTCDQTVKLSASYATKETKADLLLLVGTVESEENYIAYAAPCLLNSFNRRPVVGMIIMNIKKIEIFRDSIEKYVSTILHELLHVMVLSPQLFEYFPITKAKTVVSEMRSTKIGSTQVSKIITPGIVSAGKKHYGCSSFNGVYLENEGDSASAGSHFEKAMVGDEVMTAQANGKMIMSFWTLNLLNDCGWYSVDVDRAENLDWGKNQGCGFINANCNTKYPNFCTTEGKLACSEDFFIKQLCAHRDFTDGCLTYGIEDSSDCSSIIGVRSTSLYESSGPKSRCFASKVGGQSKAGCYTSNCVGNTIQLTIANKTLTCNETGQSIQHNDLTVICPNISDFCSRMNQTCSNDCSGRGRCLGSKECFCDYFSDGADCSTTKACNLSLTTCGKLSGLSNSLTKPDSSSVAILASVWVALIVALVG